LTLFDEEDDKDMSFMSDSEIAQMRRRRLCRIAEEAREQDGLLTQEDLAKCLMCSVRTIRRDVEALKALGVVIPTRGQQQDIGPTVSHRAPAASFLSWGVTRTVLGLRVNPEEEYVGLDQSEMGLEAYPADVTTPEYEIALES
ncbi:MAG TPA: DUF1670 domain-containing protein, partial [Candidatus Hydrogenedentes bacterium]|nr:DUF1670 domain-containing protein [Candidatus Hydrogenedentota bacterium]